MAQMRHTEEVIIALPKTEHDYAAVYEWIETEEGEGSSFTVTVTEKISQRSTL